MGDVLKFPETGFVPTAGDTLPIMVAGVTMNINDLMKMNGTGVAFISSDWLNTVERPS